MRRSDGAAAIVAREVVTQRNTMVVFLGLSFLGSFAVQPALHAATTIR